MRTVGFIVFELDASLFCFVSRAIRGANCRSYAIAFCFLLLPPFLHDPLLALLLCCVPTLRSPLPSPTTTSLFFCSMHPDRHHRPRRRPRRKAESYSLHSLACAPLLSNIAVPMFSSSPSLPRRTRLLLKRRRRTCHSVLFPFLVERSDRFLCRVLLFIFRVLAPTARGWFFLSYPRRCRDLTGGSEKRRTRLLQRRE